MGNIDKIHKNIAACWLNKVSYRMGITCNP